MRTTQRTIALGLYRSNPTAALLDAAYEAGISHIDCAYNYGGFRYLAGLGDLGASASFSISTKVGYFPGSPRDVHTLDPRRLIAAAEDSVELLGTPPDLLFLHNPESSLSVDARQARDQLHAGCAALEGAVAMGLADAWGIASWEPARLLPVVAELERPPDAIMSRVGFSVGREALDRSRELAERAGVPPDGRWGMSPLGGARAGELLAAADLRAFVDEPCSNAQAAVRAAFELPPVSTVCVSSSSPAHLREAAEASRLQANEEAVSRYLSALATR